MAPGGRVKLKLAGNTGCDNFKPIRKRELTDAFSIFPAYSDIIID